MLWRNIYNQPRAAARINSETADQLIGAILRSRGTTGTTGSGNTWGTQLECSNSLM